jgi:hypothetical protein
MLLATPGRLFSFDFNIEEAAKPGNAFGNASSVYFIFDYCNDRF